MPATGLLALVGTKLSTTVPSAIPGPVIVDPTKIPPLIFLMLILPPAAIGPA